jgi:hypothetical protein
MEDLRNVMRLVDNNSQNISEGDYLELCNLLRKIYKDRELKDMTTLIDYEHFDIFVNMDTDQAADYFYDRYYLNGISNEEDFINVQINYLQDEIRNNQKLKRISPSVKCSAIRHYCSMHNILLDEYTPKCLKEFNDIHGYDLGVPGTPFESGLYSMCKSYMIVENQFREIYCKAVEKRISKLNAWLDEIEQM